MVAQVKMQDDFTNLGLGEKPELWSNHKQRLEGHQINVTRPMWAELTKYVLTGDLEGA